MAIIQCSECGRAISDKASACVGCGAPLGTVAGFNLVPKPERHEPPSPRRIMRRAVLAALVLAAGVIWTAAVDQPASRDRVATLIATLLIVGGLCGLLVTLVQWVTSRK